MCEEKSTKEIADIVDLSPRTVEAIRDKLKVKTGAKSTAGLIMYAVKHNILNEEIWTWFCAPFLNCNKKIPPALAGVFLLPYLSNCSIFDDELSYL